MTLPVSVGDDDVIFSVEGWAIHGAGPNKGKFGAGMRFVKDDDFGTANTYAPQRTEFYNAVNTTTIQTNMTILPNGNVGIGLSTPPAKLSIVGGSTLQFGIDGNSGNNQIYLRGGTTGDKAIITLNHYGYADYIIGTGLVGGNGKLSITKTSGGTDGIIVDSNGNVGADRDWETIMI